MIKTCFLLFLFSQYMYEQRIDNFGQHINEILTAVVHGMRKDEENLYVKLATANAMLSAIDFTKENFNDDVCCIFLLF